MNGGKNIIFSAKEDKYIIDNKKMVYFKEIFLLIMKKLLINIKRMFVFLEKIDEWSLCIL